MVINYIQRTAYCRPSTFLADPCSRWDRLKRVPQASDVLASIASVTNDQRILWLLFMAEPAGKSIHIFIKL